MKDLPFPKLGLACPVCLAALKEENIFVRPADKEEDMQAEGFYLACCCSIESIYHFTSTEEAERGRSRYRGMAINAGIRRARQEVQNWYEAASAALYYSEGAFLCAEGEPSDSSAYIITFGSTPGQACYCDRCLPDWAHSPKSYVFDTRLVALCRVCHKCLNKYSEPDYSGGYSSHGDVAARDSF